MGTVTSARNHARRNGVLLANAAVGETATIATSAAIKSRFGLIRRWLIICRPTERISVLVPRTSIPYLSAVAWSVSSGFSLASLAAASIRSLLSTGDESFAAALGSVRYNLTQDFRDVDPGLNASKASRLYSNGSGRKPAFPPQPFDKGVKVAGAKRDHIPFVSWYVSSRRR